MEDTKWCFVPTCLNSTSNTFNKWFVPIPVKSKRREQWFKAVKRNYCPNSERSILYCCSDHFNLNEDAVSIIEKEGEIVVKLKKSIIPRLNNQDKDALKPVSSMDQLPKQTKLIPIPSPKKVPEAQMESQPSEVVSLVDGTSSDEDEPVDIVGVPSNPQEIRKILMGHRVTSMKQNTGKTPLSKQPSACSSKTAKTKQSNALNSANKSPNQSPTFQVPRGTFESLRKAIPSICSQQGMTREQVMDEAVKFIIQMRNKSDYRQGTMHYVMECNSALKAKIEQLEQLLLLHEKNEIVLTKEIVNRRLGTLNRQKPVNPLLKPSKPKATRKSL